MVPLTCSVVLCMLSLWGFTEMILVMIGKTLKGISISIPDCSDDPDNRFLRSSVCEGGSGAPPEP